MNNKFEYSQMSPEEEAACSRFLIGSTIVGLAILFAIVFGVWWLTQPM